MKGTLRWLPIEEIKGCPNPITSAVEVRKRWEAAAKATRPGEDTPRQYYCYFCGRPMKSMQAIYGHGQHCQKKKAYRTAMRDGIAFTVGAKTYTVRTKRMKVLRMALTHEEHLNHLIAEGSLGAREAELAYLLFFQGVSLARGSRFIRYHVLDAEPDEPDEDTPESGRAAGRKRENEVEITEVPPAET
jgi:hypothetical protein